MKLRHLKILALIGLLSALCVCYQLSTKPTASNESIPSGQTTATETTPAVKGVIKIGHASPLTGNQAQTGQDQRNGALLAVEELNRAGGIHGYRVELVAYDDKADPKEAVSVAHRLANDPGVIAVVGHLNSGCSLPASAVYQQYGLAMITPVSTDDALTEQNRNNVFRICIRNSDQGPAAARFAIRDLGKKHFYVIDDKSAYGAGIAGEFIKAAENKGGTIIGRDSISEGETDFRPLLTKLKGKRMDFIYFGGMFPEGALLVKQARELGIEAPLLGGDGLFAPKFIEVAGPAAEGSIATHIAPLTGTSLKQRHFFRSYRERFKVDVLAYAPLSYDAVMMIAEAVKTSGKVSRQSVIDRLHHEEFQYHGIIGITRFDTKGDTLNKNPYFYEVRGRQFQLSHLDRGE